MAKKEYAFYPGCSSQEKASSSNYQHSVQTMCDELDITLNEIPDWNCCAASIGYAKGGELPRIALSARNIALAVRTSSPPARPAGSPRARPKTACWKIRN